MSVNIEILDYVYTDDTNTAIDWDKSIVGELDVTDHSDFPLALTFQISDFKDLTSTSGDYSKTFKVPATKNNNNLLKHLYIPNLSTNNKVTDKKPCRIIFDNLYSLVGLIQVDGVGGYGETPSYYSCVFFGSNLSWANEIQDSYMNTDMWGSDGEDIEYNKDNIVATWQHTDSDNASNSPIVYPITSYGDYNELGDAKTIQLLDTRYGDNGANSSQLGVYGFDDNGDSYGTPPPVSDWRPAVFIKTTLDKIFNAIGYKINSAFMDTDMFKKLVWLLPNFQYNNPDERAIKYGYGNHFTGEGLVGSFTATALGTTFVADYAQLNLNNIGSGFILNDNRDNTGWDANTGEFTAQDYGNYTVILDNMGVYWNNLAGAEGLTHVEYVTIQIQVKTVGQATWKQVSTTPTAAFGVTTYGITQHGSYSFSKTEFPRFLNKGDKLRIIGLVKLKNNAYNNLTSSIDFHFFGSSTPTNATYSNNANGTYTIDIDPLPVTYGQTYNLKDVINKDYKQVDFVKGVAHAFNLQMTTDEVTKTVNIEPYISFYKPYKDAIDWTYKLDRSSEISDKWIESDLKRTLVFKYKSDNADAKVKYRGEQFFDKIEDEYPYKETLPDTFKKGNSTFENPFFAGTFNAQDQDTVQFSNFIPDTAYSACLWTENVQSNELARPVKGFEFLPRLLYWNKYSPTGMPTPFSTFGLKKFAAVQTWLSDIKYLNPNADFAPQAHILSNIYPQATMVNRDNTTSPNLAYGNVDVRDYDDATLAYTQYSTVKGLYDTYYRNMIEGLKQSPRLRTVSVSLNITDIVNLDFTKLVYIDGVYWRINKIIDYKPNKNESTKVELIEWYDLGSFNATPAQFGSSGSSSMWGQNGNNATNENIGL